MHTLHSDLCGPYPVKSLGGGQYVLTLLDEHSGYAAVAILRLKSDAPAQLQQMILEWEAKTGLKCKNLFTDRGSEYTQGVMKDWCVQQKIVHDFSAPRTPEQNGKAERLNQTLNDMVRAMLFQYNLFTPLWAHAMMYAVKLYNAGLVKRLNKTRPWRGLPLNAPGASIKFQLKIGDG